MSMAAAAFMFAAIATSTGALAFLAGQRASGRTSKDVAGCYENAALLQGVARELHDLADEVEKAPAPAEGREHLVKARDRLEEAITTLTRGADRVV